MRLGLGVGTAVGTPVGASTHTEPTQARLSQSSLTTQRPPTAHAGQSAPPQSTSVSPLLTRPSVQYAAVGPGLGTVEGAGVGASSCTTPPTAVNDVSPSSSDPNTQPLCEP